jgi:dCTP deaminase
MTTLSDVDINAAMAKGRLVVGGVAGQVGPACYELRMGPIYYDLTEDDKRIDAGATNTVLIKPGHRVVLITQEQLAVPDDMIARVTSKGSLFSVGLSPASTYADPGFKGNLGVVTQNLSDKYIELPVGEPIAKVDFSPLSSAAAKPYSGQHGFQTQIWPIKHHLQKTYDAVKNDPRVDTELEEAYKILPGATARILKQLYRRQRVIDWAIVATLVVNSLLLGALSNKWFEPFVAVVTELIATGIIAVMVYRSTLKGYLDAN